MKTVDGEQVMEVLDAKGGQFIEITYPHDYAPGNVYQVTSHQPMLDGTHDREPWRKIRAFRGSQIVYLHPLNECKLKPKDNDDGKKWGESA